MAGIVLVDTSVFLNILAVPGFDQDRSAVLDRFKQMIQDGWIFLLPAASIFETGDHIADLPNGALRRKHAGEFVAAVLDALNGISPWRATSWPTLDEVRSWLAEFPDVAQRNKRASKPGEGISLSDLSIIKEWERLKARHALSRVAIWSLDSDLNGYDTGDA